MARTQDSGGRYRAALKYDAFRQGDVYYVDSTNGVDDSRKGGGTDPLFPLATIGQAISNAQAGDTIVCAAGHAETITAAAGIDASVAGLSIKGLGNVDNRPTISYTTAAAASFDITAASVLIENFAFDLTGVDAVTAGVNISAAGCTLKNCRFVTADAGGQAALGILTTAAADRLTLENCEFEGSSDAGTVAQVRLVGSDRTHIKNCRFYGDCSVGNISVLTTAVTNLLLENCDMNNLNAVDVNFEGLAASTGSLRWNTCRIATDGQTTWLNTLGALQLFENYGVNNDGETGKLIGTASV